MMSLCDLSLGGYHLNRRSLVALLMITYGDTSRPIVPRRQASLIFCSRLLWRADPLSKWAAPKELP